MLMERMQVRVQSIKVYARGVRAVVIAVSQERVMGKPRASVKMRLRLERVEGEAVRDLLSRVREEAIRYLDIN